MGGWRDFLHVKGRLKLCFQQDNRPELQDKCVKPVDNGAELQDNDPEPQDNSA